MYDLNEEMSEHCPWNLPLRFKFFEVVAQRLNLSFATLPNDSQQILRRRHDDNFDDEDV